MRWPRRRTAPAVSIVLATHNRASLLPLALDSALGQDYPDLEVLVMDDGSTDDTPQVLSGYASRLAPERFRFARHANMGQARTLNRGYELARGELIGYLSDDDVLEPDLVKELARVLAKRPDASAAYPGYRLIDGQGQITDTWLPVSYTPAAAVSRHDTIIGPGALARRSALEASGGWDPSYRWMGDLIMWLGVASWGPVLRVPQPLAAWRRHRDAATTQTGLERAAEHLRLFEHGLRLDPETAEDPKLRAEALRNACIVAAWFSGHTDFAPDEPVTMLDQDQPLVSAWASGQDPATGEFDLAHAERVAGALRALGLLTLELAEARETDPSQARPAGGYPRAVERLRAAGALAGPDGAPPQLDAAEIGPALIEAALDCAADIPAERRRFLMPDRRQSALVGEELRTLVGLRLGASEHGRGLVDAANHELAQRRQQLARA